MCLGEENQGWLETDKGLQILGKDLKKQMKENKSLTFKTVLKKDKLTKTNTRNINKKLNRKKSLTIVWNLKTRN